MTFAELLVVKLAYIPGEMVCVTFPPIVRSGPGMVSAANEDSAFCNNALLAYGSEIGPKFGYVPPVISADPVVVIAPPA